MSRAELPLPEKQDICLVVFTAIMALGNSHETCDTVDTVAVKAEWVPFEDIATRFNYSR